MRFELSPILVDVQVPRHYQPLVHSVASCIQEQNSCLPPYSKNLTVIDISFREVNELMETILFTFSISFKCVLITKGKQYEWSAVKTLDDDMIVTSNCISLELEHSEHNDTQKVCLMMFAETCQ